MREEIRGLQQRLGLTVVYVTHDQSEALAVSDRIVVMRNAEIAQVGTPAELYAQPQSVFVATFTGEANHVRGELLHSEAGLAEVALGSLRLTMPDRGLPPGPTDVVIRPEAVRILAAASASGLPATVSRATYLGSHTEYHLATGIGALFAISPDRLRRSAPGEAVTPGLDPEGIMVVRG